MKWIDLKDKKPAFNQHVLLFLEPTGRFEPGEVLLISHWPNGSDGATKWIPIPPIYPPHGPYRFAKLDPIFRAKANSIKKELEARAPKLEWDVWPNFSSDGQPVISFIWVIEARFDIGFDDMTLEYAIQDYMIEYLLVNPLQIGNFFDRVVSEIAWKLAQELFKRE